MRAWKKEVLKLLNDGEHSEALQCFRQHHNFVNRFVCQCGDISAERTGLGCNKCGSHNIKIKVVEEKVK